MIYLLRDCLGPGSFLEVSKLIPHLTSSSKSQNSADDGEYPVFDVVAPSLPNFGFSSESKNRGFGLDQYAEVCHKLMLKLGYNEYGMQCDLLFEWFFGNETMLS